jgi:hypothetical protein
MEGEISSPLLLKERTQIYGGGSGGEEQRGGSSATTMVVLSTLVAVSGSYVFGSAVSSFTITLTIIVSKCVVHERFPILIHDEYVGIEFCLVQNLGPNCP